MSAPSLPLLADPKADWPDRILVTHVGRWARGQAAAAKYRNCSVRNTRWHMVSTAKTGLSQWQLFDVQVDPGEEDDLAREHPKVVQSLQNAYDQWWDSVQPQLVNENVLGPNMNPFKELYWQQFGGGPDEALRRRMDPTAAEQK